MDNSYYDLLGLPPSCDAIEIRRTYRELSKKFHPDTTTLPADLAKVKFQQLNSAYATLSNPQKRLLYDLQMGYGRSTVVQSSPVYKSSYSHPVDRLVPQHERPLSAGEIFALFILVATFLGCVGLVFLVAYLRGESL